MLKLFFITLCFISVNASSTTIENEIENIQQSTGEKKAEQLLTLLDEQHLTPNDKFLVLNGSTLI